MTVKTPQKFTPQEIEQIKTLQIKIRTVQMQFGQLQISKIKLEEQESLLKNELNSLEKEETNLAKTLSSKYGKGTLDTETGDFTPIE